MDKTGFILTGSALLLLMTNLAHSQEEFSGDDNRGRVIHFDPDTSTKLLDNYKPILNKSARGLLTSSFTRMVLPSFYIMVFVIGLPANGLAMYNLITKVQRLPSTIFLMNLAVADLLLSLVLPFKIHYHILGNNWLFGEALCRTVTAFFYGNMYCSVLLLTFISIDRYFALVHPFLSKRFRDNSFAVGSCCVIWLLVVLAMLPFLFQRQTYPIHNLNITTCHDVLPKELNTGYFFYYFMCLVVIGFFIPSLVTIFCYVSIIRSLMLEDSKYSKAVRTMVLVLIVFLICFTPSNVTLLVHHSQFHPTDSNKLYFYYLVCLVLSTFNNCLDPFIYYYISEEFRNEVRRILFSKVKRGEGSRKILIRTDSSSASRSVAPLRSV
ncbi:proteinase-activated receptor 3-like isoform X3 [Stegostoma tigrinum]|uniref:proteinase-activated receptor 3-like isoform X3 n=1 Tax=Stegostoma tigrinum TaxID=3053191 RepID=UPI00287033AC|nr:proteinase-activated receptor 3-like isoform X3 [Stegostoma tigrinum]